ncbi:MAG: hypothetical protein LC437_09370 [Thiohalomonas sp.]|nr:hypothetical protein [Thiohalomonas sp.]
MTELTSSWPFFLAIYCCTYELNSGNECWNLILAKAMEKFKVNLCSDNYVGLPPPS